MPILFVDEEDAVDFKRREARHMAESEVDHTERVEFDAVHFDVLTELELHRPPLFWVLTQVVSVRPELVGLLLLLASISASVCHDERDEETAKVVSAVAIGVIFRIVYRRDEGCSDSDLTKPRGSQRNSPKSRQTGMYLIDSERNIHRRTV